MYCGSGRDKQHGVTNEKVTCICSYGRHETATRVAIARRYRVRLASRSTQTRRPAALEGERHDAHLDDAAFCRWAPLIPHRT